jgi:hypothetical protein
MKQKIEQLIRDLKKENDVRTEKINDPNKTEYNHSFYVHTYNNTIDFINRLEAILK